VVAVGLCRPSDTIVLGSAKGQAIRFDEAAVRSMGRTSYGVRGIRLRGDDRAIDMIVADPNAYLITACEHGHGKRTPMTDYPIKGRGGQGVINIRTDGRNGEVVGIGLCRDDDDVMFITAEGMIVRSPVAEFRPMGRNTQGVRLVNLKDEDRLVAIEVINAREVEEFQQITPVRAVRQVTPLELEDGEEVDTEDSDEDETPEPEPDDEPSDDDAAEETPENGDPGDPNSDGEDG
jgi:DNA gyrase subunit A